MLDSHCRESLTEGWACVWGRVGREGRRPGVSTGRGRGQRGLGWVWGEGSQEGRGEVPPQAACFRSLCQLGGLGREGSHQSLVMSSSSPGSEGKDKQPLWRPHVALSQGNKKCPLVLGAVPEHGGGAVSGVSPGRSAPS